MKHCLLLTATISLNSFALDFETEWSKFAKDFAKLRTSNSVAVASAPVIQTPATVPAPKLLDTNTESNTIQLVDPKSPARLGRNLQNLAMREKMEKLYNNPNTVVYSLTLE
jgi:hypothetical protein